jgi:hypothetical protein
MCKLILCLMLTNLANLELGEVPNSRIYIGIVLPACDPR